MKKALLGAALAATLGLAATASFADTLGDIKARGHLLCGVSEDVSSETGSPKMPVNRSSTTRQ